MQETQAQHGVDLNSWTVWLGAVNAGGRLRTGDPTDQQDQQ